LEILILERLKVPRTVSKYSVAGSEPNTVLVAKSDTLGGAWLVRGTLLRDQVLRRQVKWDFFASEFRVTAIFRTSPSSQ